MSEKKRCGQCERFTWSPFHHRHGCNVSGFWSTNTAFTEACASIRPRERLDPRRDPDPLPQDGQEREERRRYPSWPRLEDSLL